MKLLLQKAYFDIFPKCSLAHFRLQTFLMILRSWLPAGPQTPGASPCQTPTPEKSDARSRRGFTEEAEPQRCSAAEKRSPLSPHIWPLPRLPPGAPRAMRSSPEQTTTQLWSPPAPRFCQMRTLSFKIPGS